MSIKETHEWAKEKMTRWGELTAKTETIANRPQEKIDTPPLLQFENPSFFGDVCRRDGDLIFHFFPTTNDRFNVKVDVQGEKVWVFNEGFADHLGDAFIEVFKFPERLFWDYVPELNSWVVRCSGAGNNPLNDALIEQVLVAIKKKNHDD